MNPLTPHESNHGLIGVLGRCNIHPMPPRAARWIGVAVLLACSAGAAPVDFQKDVQPILARNCYECHDAEKQRSGLRLDRKTDALRGGDSGQLAISPGQPDESLLIQKITATDPEERMPAKGDPLSPAEIETLRAWIVDGAVWPSDGSENEVHWAYVPPVRPAIPEIKNSGWAKNPIDHFIAARLERENLKPSPEAAPETLVRRLSLDLIGLPPTLEELDRFATNPDETTWAEAVEYYLNSPHYGEQRARRWLDLARYADSHGYERDPGREMWLYRDWVIDAFNRNLSFDQFTIEQIAGDMLPEATESQRIASGFHRNTMLNTEGGVDPEEARVETIVDRVNTTATVWLGTTLACAQCHTHKYDPFTLKEYYEFYAFFNNVNEPDIEVPSAEQREQRASLQDRIAQLEKTLNSGSPELNTAQSAWEYALAENSPKWTALGPVGFLSTGGANLLRLEDDSLLASGPNPTNDTYTVVADTETKVITGFRLEVIPDSSLPQKSSGRHPNGSFVLSKFEATAAPRGNPKKAAPLKFKRAAADYVQNGHSVENLIDDKSGNGWAASAADEKMRARRYVLFELAEPIRMEQGSTLTFTLRNDTPWGEANIGRFRISLTSSDNVIPEHLVPASVITLLSVAPIERTPQQREQLASYYRSIAPALQPVREELAQRRGELDQLQKQIPKTLVMQERKEDRRETHIHLRGSFLSKGDQVTPAVPAVLNDLADADPNRLDLAHWLVSRENPLTARVVVNRAWSQLFGRGIVETEDDFGTQGAPPVHPELLDWLAVELMESGWDMKALYRTLVSTATYRQSSGVSPELLERDPDNRLLARGPRFRVVAENVRDIALTASGLLEREIGGPSVYPSQPDRIWTQIYGNEKWVMSDDGNQYRRGLYTYWKRTSPYPAFMSFDAPSREFCTARRPRTNTPLQALTTLNDPAYIEAAQALARRAMRESAEPAGRINYAFRLAVSRFPSPKERERLLALYDTEFEHYSAHQEAATLMAFREGAKVAEGVNLPEAAAWTVVANVILNLDETITKN